MEKKILNFTAEGPMTMAELCVDSFRFRGSDREEAEALESNNNQAEELADWLYDNLTNAACRRVVDRLSIHLGI